MVTNAADSNVFSLQDYKFNKTKLNEVESNLESVAGDRVIGELTPKLIEDFVEVVGMQWVVDDFNEIIKDRIAEGSKDIVRSTLNGVDDMQELHRRATEIRIFDNDLEAYEYFKSVAMYEYSQKKLVYDIRQLIDNYTHVYDVRAGFCVVIKGKKYRL